MNLPFVRRVTTVCLGVVPILLALFLEMALPKGAALAAGSDCEIANVLVYSPNLADAETACEGAGDAIGFLAGQGLETSGQIEVHIVDKLPDTNHSFAPTSSPIGVYLSSERQAYVLTFIEFAKENVFLDLPVDRVLYKSLMTHEVAHIIAHTNFVVPKPRIEAQEYIAYVTMFATMPSKYREGLLSRFPGHGFETEAQINTSIYLFDPLRFGAQAYRHFLKPTNGTAFVKGILRGYALSGGNGL